MAAMSRGKWGEMATRSRAGQPRVNIAERIGPMPGNGTNGHDSSVYEEAEAQTADRQVRLATGDAGRTIAGDDRTDDLLDDDEYDDVETSSDPLIGRTDTAPRRAAVRPAPRSSRPGWLPEARWLVLIALAI